MSASTTAQAQGLGLPTAASEHAPAVDTLLYRAHLYDSVLVIAFIKVRFVGLEFMELRQAPLPLRLIFELWLILACATLLILYWLSPLA